MARKDRSRAATSFDPQLLGDPPFARWLLGAPAWAWLWLPVRLWLGWTWLQAGSTKIGVPAWTETGIALRAFWERAVLVSDQGRPPIAFDWYRSFIQFLLDGGHHVWFARLVVWAEILVGAALILGAFTGVAALAGGFMNFNFMMAGTASTNPLLFLFAVFLVLAWKNAGWIGLDRWLLPLLGTPWEPGVLAGMGPRRPRGGGG